MAAGFEEYESSKLYAEPSFRAAPAPEVEPDPDRYAPPRGRQSRLAPQDARQQEMAEQAQQYAQYAAMARSGQNDNAKFVLMDLPAYVSRMSRAVRENDIDTLSGLVSEVDGYVDGHYDGLVGWTGLSAAGKEGSEAAARLSSVLDGTYKDTLGIRPLLEGTSEEYKTRKASRLSRELSIDSASARAVFDRDDAMYPAFSMFSDLATPVSAGGLGRPSVPGQMTRESKVEFLRGAARLKDAGAAFSDAGSMSRFLSAFNQAVNKNGAYAGDAVLEKVAKGFLAGGHGLTEHDYVARYGALVDRLSEQATGGASAKGATPADRRMAMHEANEIASEFMALGGDGGAEQASALESAAATVRMANDMFGVSVRGGPGYARKVASAALASMGVPGADDGGLFRMVSDAASDLSTLVSPPTRDLMSVLADGKGQAHVGTMKAQNPYSNMEMFAVKALGRAMSRLSDGVDGAMPSGRSWGALKQFANGNDQARLGLKRAMADALDTRFGDRELSLRIADGMVDRFLGRSNDGRTIEERLRGYTGLFDPVTDRPEIPAAVRLGTNLSSAEFNGALAAMAGNPSAVIPTLKGDRELASSASNFARETLDRLERGKDVLSSHKWNEALGDLVVKATGMQDPTGLVKAGWLMDFSRKGRGNNFEAKDIRFLEKAITSLAERISADPEGAIDDAVLLAVLARGSGWRGFLDGVRESKAARFAGAGGQVYSGISRDRAAAKAREMADLVDAALAKVGVGKNVGLGSALTTLSANPMYARSALVSSGLVTKGDTPLDYRNFLVTLQQRAYADIYADRKDSPTRLQEAARRAYRSFGTRDDVLGKLKSDVLEHFRADGASDEELVRIEKLVSDQLADEYRLGGPAAAELLAKKRMGMSRRFFPAVDPKTGDVNPNAVEVSNLMTDTEFADEVRRLQDVWRQKLGREYADTVFFDANARGLATWKHNVAMAERVRVGQMLKVAPEQQ